MIHENFIFLAAAINLTGTLTYFKALLSGKVKPNRITWGLWILPALITIFAQIEEGVGKQVVLTMSAVTGPILIFTASFFVESSYWQLQRRDYALGFLSVIGLVLWQITGEGYLAIILALTADFFASLPTLIKSYTHPESEDPYTYGLCVLAASIAMLTIDNWVFEEYAFMVWMFIFCGAVSVFLITGPKRKSRK